MSSWWSEQRIETTVTREYIISKLPSNALYRHLAFGDGLTNDTYLDWILTRGKRLFLILVEVGIPDYIFEAVDRSLDDSDLPLSEEAIWDLDLSHGRTNSLDKLFNRYQFRYLVQQLYEGSHVDYEGEEIVPVRSVGKRPGILPSLSIDRVQTGDATFIRRRVLLEGDGVDKIHFILHLKTLQRLKHPHLVSVFATYTQGGYGHVLFTPSLDVTLRSFLDEPPKSFKSLPKAERRRILLSWTHCLSDAIAYLHERGYAHQAIRPSNIYISGDNRIYLGESAAIDALENKENVYDKEVYEYASPEQWQRKPVLQELAPLRTTHHGGGRTAQRIPKAKSRLPSLSPDDHLHRPILTPTSSKTVRRPPSARTRSSHTPSASTVTSSSATPTTHTSLTSSSSSTGASTLPKRTVITTFAPVSLPSLFPPDIFSLSTIHVHLLSALFSLASSSQFSSKFSSKNLKLHLAKRNRNAGRGGAPPDRSFHANLTQVSSWMDKIEKEARGKEQRGEERRIFEAVGLLAKIVRKGLSHAGTERWKARDVETHIGMIVGRRGGCCGEEKTGRSPEEASEAGGSYNTGEDESIIILDDYYTDSCADGNETQPEDWVIPEFPSPVSPTTLHHTTSTPERHGHTTQDDVYRRPSWPLLDDRILPIPIR